MTVDSIPEKPSGIAALDAVREVIGWGLASTGHSLRRVATLIQLVDRAGSALDDIAELRRSAQHIADNLAALSTSAAGIDRHAERLTDEIEAVAQLVPTLQRLTEIVDPLDTTVVRLGRFVDRLPGGKRPARTHAGDQS